MSSGIGQWQNSPHVMRQDAEGYGRRFGVYYAKRTTRDAGELLAGYFNHEDPRPHPSRETPTGKRIRSALLSVLVVTDDAGSRPAFVPMAGSLGPAFVGAALYEDKDWGYALRGVGVSYGCYFVKALYREFRPEMAVFTGRLLHKKTGPTDVTIRAAR